MSAPPTVEPGSIVLFSDIGCPWASLAVHRLRTHRAALGLDGAVRIEHRAFPLELFNDQPTPKLVVDAEVAIIGAHEPSLGWQPWSAPAHTYPVTTLVAMEAVQAAKAPQVGGPGAAEQLDAALRHAFFAESRCISVWSEVMAVAETCDAVDEDALARTLREGTGRAAVMAQWQQAGEVAKGSPHLFLPDGTDAANPGLAMSWTDAHGRGFPVIDADDPSVYDDLLRRAAA